MGILRTFLGLAIRLHDLSEIWPSTRLAWIGWLPVNIMRIELITRSEQSKRPFLWIAKLV